MEYPFKEGSEKSLLVCLSNINKFDYLKKLEINGLTVQIINHELKESLMSALLKSKNLQNLQFNNCSFDLEFIHEWFSNSSHKNYFNT